MAETASLLAHSSGAVLNYAVLCITYIVLTKVYDWTASFFFLGGLTRLELVDGSTQLHSNAVQQPASKKQEKKLQRQLQQNKSSTYNITMTYMQRQFLLCLEFFETFNTTMLFATMIAANTAAVLVSRHLFGVGKAFLPLNMAAALTGWLLYSMYQMEWAHAIISKQDKWGMAVFGTIGGILAGCLLSRVPPSLLGVDTWAAAHEIKALVTHVVELRFEDLPEDALAGLTPEAIRTVLIAILTVVAGALSGLLLSPGLRYSRLVLQALSPPAWSQEYIVYSTWQRFLIRAAFSLPFVLVALWVTPLTDVLPIHPSWLPALRLGILLASVAGMVATLRPLAQSFLYTALLNWYVVRHNSAAMDEATRASILRHNTQLVNRQTCKVAVQLAVMPLLLTAVTGALALNSFHVAKLEGPDGQPSPATQLLAGFVAWWACLWWCLYNMVSVLFVRLGVLSNTQGV